MSNKLKVITPLPERSFQIYGRSHRLKTIFDCNRLLAKIINQCLQGKLDEARATKIAYIIACLMKGLEMGELEKKLNEIEMRLNNGTNENTDL
jgi:hypothetical protein